MKVLGYLIVQLVVRLVRPGVEIIATWSLDTVNHYPLTRPVRALE